MDLSSPVHDFEEGKDDERGEPIKAKCRSGSASQKPARVPEHDRLSASEMRATAGVRETS
jgi:hypothetical protein